MIVSLLVVIGAGVAFAVVAVVLWRRARDKQQPAPPLDAGDGGFDNRLYASECALYLCDHNVRSIFSR